MNIDCCVLVVLLCCFLYMYVVYHANVDIATKNGAQAFTVSASIDIRA